MSDLFHENVPTSFIQQVWEVMAECPQHHFQILTKRPDRMAKLFGDQKIEVLSNVWVGTSIEGEEVAERAI